jgi:hypothetical protein
MSRIEWFKKIDGVEMYFCTGHNEYLPKEHFNIDNRNKHGLSARCRACQKVKRQETSINENIQDAANLFYQALGYDLNSGESIHEQFLTKHKLKK